MGSDRRIVVSTVCGLLCILLIVLWMRSYQWKDVITAPGDRSQRIGSYNGWVTIRWKDDRLRPGRTPPANNWELVSISKEELEQKFAQYESRGVKIERPKDQFGLIDSGALQFHYWLPTVVFLVIATLPWLPLRFNLRSLLIAMTLVSVVLGLIVWAAR